MHEARCFTQESMEVNLVKRMSICPLQLLFSVVSSSWGPFYIYLFTCLFLKQCFFYLPKTGLVHPVQPSVVSNPQSSCLSFVSDTSLYFHAWLPIYVYSTFLHVFVHIWQIFSISPGLREKPNELPLPLSRVSTLWCWKIVFCSG